MHEAALARQILTATLERASAARADRIRVVRGWVAESEALSPESLEFHFAAHARGTAAEGARLDLRLTRVDALCGGCGESFVPEHHALVCPTCGSPNVTLLGRTGLGIDTLDVD